MKRDLALLHLKELISDQIVVAVYQTCFDWIAINPRDLNYVSTGVMGQASSHALGLALANRDKQVIVFDGDGSLLMNLGSLVTIANTAPENLHHFVFVNGVYEVNGAHPIPGSDKIDFAAMAIAAGYRDATHYTDLETFRTSVTDLSNLQGPTMVTLGIEPGAPYPRDYDFIHSEQARARFRQALTQNT